MSLICFFHHHPALSADTIWLGVLAGVLYEHSPLTRARHLVQRAGKRGLISLARATSELDADASNFGLPQFYSFIDICDCLIVPDLARGGTTPVFNLFFFTIFYAFCAR